MEPESIKVLLVEDNLGDARLLYEGLEEAFAQRFQVAHVRRLGEALEYLWNETCDVVLLDLGLPDSHGIDSLAAVRGQAPGVPIVVLTGFQEETLEEQALKEGAQDYLVKGQTESKLLARSVRYAIARKAAEAALVQGITLAKADELQGSCRRLIAIHERVRRLIAGQLDDGIREELVVLRGRLQEFSKSTGPALDETRLLGEVIDKLGRVIEQGLGTLSRRLYPSTLGHGLIPALQSLQEQFGTPLTIEIEADGELASLDKVDDHPLQEEVGLAVYRIVEEALANVVKHAKAGKAAVRLDPSGEGWLRLTVKDNGLGFDLASAPRGLGIATMQDYAGAMGGECVVHSAPGAGTEVAAVLPLLRAVAE